MARCAVLKTLLFKEAGSIHKYLWEHARKPTKLLSPESSKTKDYKIKCRTYFIQILGFLPSFPALLSLPLCFPLAQDHITFNTHQEDFLSIS